MSKIKTLRKKYGLTQQEFGRLIGFSRDQIYRRETGKCQVTPDFEAKIEDIEPCLRNGYVDFKQLQETT